MTTARRLHSSSEDSLRALELREPRLQLAVDAVYEGIDLESA